MTSMFSSLLFVGASEKLADPEMAERSCRCHGGNGGVVYDVPDVGVAEDTAPAHVRGTGPEPLVWAGFAL